MTDTMTEQQPTAGWYPDPSSQAPYRWWDGHRWSTRTTQDPAAAPTTTPAPRVLAPATELPSRRSLRTAGPDAPAIHDAPREALADSDTGAFIPLNPLVGRPAGATRPGVGPSPASPMSPDVQVPEAWIANSPALDHAVYGTGAPFAAAIVAARPVAAVVNAYVNLGAGFALIGLLYQGVIAVWGTRAATSSAGVAVAAALVAGMVLGVIGIVRADRFTAPGSRVERAPGLLVLLVCLVALAAQSGVAGGILDTTGLHLVGTPFGGLLGPLTAHTGSGR